MQLLTVEVVAKLPPLYSSEDKREDEILVVVKFFAHWSHWTWYAIEGSYVDATMATMTPISQKSITSALAGSREIIQN